MEAIFVEIINDEAIPPRKRSRVNCAAWDSVAQINLILAIEQEFGIIVGEDEAAGLTSFAAALAIVEERVRNK